MFDEAIAWMVANDLDKQWGKEPWSKNAVSVETVGGWCSSVGSWIAARLTGKVLGMLVFAPSAPGYVPPATVRELFISVLITSRSPDAKGVGRKLLVHADDVAQEQGVEQLRVDCFAGNDDALIRYYESAGYQRAETFDNDGWPGQVLVRPIPKKPSD